jgi:hypothetical protein
MAFKINMIKIQILTGVRFELGFIIIVMDFKVQWSQIWTWAIIIVIDFKGTCFLWIYVH